VQKILISKARSDATHHSKRIDAHLIANRIMRKDNYLIALFNKDVLDLTLPLLGPRQYMTRLMQDYLTYGLLSYIFDSTGKFRKRFLKESNRERLADG
jgi:hypothetical protein